MSWGTNPDITEDFALGNWVAYGQVMTKQETFHLSPCDLQGMLFSSLIPETMREPTTH